MHFKQRKHINTLEKPKKEIILNGIAIEDKCAVPQTHRISVNERERRKITMEETRLMRHVSDSAVEQTQIILSSHINGAGRLFGGQLMEWIDIVASVVARRHSHHNQTTASIDNLQFKEAVHLNDTLLLFGKITYVGHTSMEVQVDSYVENLEGKRRLVNTAHVVMVALDEHDRPIEVPGLIVETEEEKAAWAAGEKRNELRKQRRIENY